MHNVAKARKEAVKEKSDPLLKWFGGDSLKGHVPKAEVCEGIVRDTCKEVPTTDLAFFSKCFPPVGRQVPHQVLDLVLAARVLQLPQWSGYSGAVGLKEGNKVGHLDLTQTFGCSELGE